MRKKSSRFIGVFIILLSIVTFINGVNVEASKNFVDVKPENSHYEGIMYLNHLDVYDDQLGTRFYPNDSITRNEVVHILRLLYENELKKIRQYKNKPFTDVQSSNKYFNDIVWSYEVGIFDGDNGKFNGEDNLKRSHLAKILVNTFDLQSKGTYELNDVTEKHWAYEFVSILYGNGITTGNSGNYMPNQFVTNGQFASFIYRTIQVSEGEQLEVAPVEEDENTSASENVLATFNTEYDFVWHQIGKNKNLELEGVNDRGQIVGLYSAVKDKELFNVTIGQTTQSEVVARHGQSLKEIVKNNTFYQLGDSNGYGIYLIDNKYVTFFYDNFKNDVVRSILWIDEEVEKNKEGYYGNSNVNVRQEGFENLMVELMNEARANEGIAILKGTQNYKEIARLHSQDMIDNKFFSHTGSNGSNVVDRMLASGMDFISSGGENIAYGQFNVIYAHEGFMNSKGHRENILRKGFTHTFTGVEFNGTIPYFTVNFYSIR